jgi:DNA mismatch endonuclease, patch repair protein
VPAANQLKVDPRTARRMGGIRQQGTAPELLVRIIASSLGLAYRVRNRDLPGSPDLANRKRRWAIFVHGCFWHAHHGCELATVPKRNRGFWRAKFVANVERDRRAVNRLRGLGYSVITIWGCELTSPNRIRTRLGRALLTR